MNDEKKEKKKQQQILFGMTIVSPLRVAHVCSVGARISRRVAADNEPPLITADSHFEILRIAFADKSGVEDSGGEGGI